MGMGIFMGIFMGMCMCMCMCMWNVNIPMPIHTSISMDNAHLTRDKIGRKHNKGFTCMYIHYPLFIVHVHVHGYGYIHGHMHVHMHVKCAYTHVYA